MITLINGNVQNAGGIKLPNGSIAFQLNMDATIVAQPGGLVPSQQVNVFQFDSTGNLIQPAQLWSNAELNPQNASGLGTYYLVTLYDANGARVNSSPMWWQFPNPAGATVDISFMTAISTIGGNVIFYPNLSGSAFNGVNAQVASYTAVPEDSGKLITFASANPVTLHLPATVPADTWFILVQNIGPGVLTIDRNGNQIDAANVNLSVPATQGTFIGSSAVSYFTERGLLTSNISVAGYLGWHNVMDYGAVGDGSTDDSAAIQAAINAATLNPTGGGRVYFPNPPLNYYMAKPVSVDCYNTVQLYLYGDGGSRGGGISQFARAPRIRVQGGGVSLLLIDNTSGGGGNYQVGDTGTIVGGNNDATYQVTAVSSVGQVKTFNVTNAGTGYSAAQVATTVSSGSGNGLFHIHITSVNGSGVITGSALGAGAGADIEVTVENLDFVAANGNAIFANGTPFLLLNNCGVASNADFTRDYTAPLILEGSTLWFKAKDSNFTMTDHNNGEFRPVMHATQVTVSGPNGIYAITPETGAGIVFPNGGEGNRNYIGMKFTAAGFAASAGANNGTFTCVAASSTSLTLNNASAVNETHAGTVQCSTVVDPSSWAPPTVLVVGDDPNNGSILFNFDFCTFAFGGMKIEVITPGGNGETFGEIIFNMCVLEGAFGSPMLQFENVSAAGGSGGATCARTMFNECSLSDLAHPTPLCSVKGYPNHVATLGSMFVMHTQETGAVVQNLYAGFGNVSGVHHEDPSVTASIVDVDSTTLTGAGLIHQQNAGYDMLGPVVGPASSYLDTTSEGGALRTFVADPALSASATSMRDADGTDYFGPGGSNAPFDVRVGRGGVSIWQIDSPSPAPTVLAGANATTGGGTMALGTYYAVIASGNRNAAPFTVSAASAETAAITLSGGNNSINFTWTPSTNNPGGIATLYITSVNGGSGNETHAINIADSGSHTMLSLPAANQVPNIVGTLLVPLFTFDGSGAELPNGIVFTNVDGFGNGSAGTAVTTTTKSAGSGPTTAETVVDYLKIKVGGNTRWIPLMA